MNKKTKHQQIKINKSDPKKDVKFIFTYKSLSGTLNIPCAFVNWGLLQAPPLPPNLASTKKSTTPYDVK